MDVQELQLQTLIQKARDEITATSSPAALNELRVHYLGKKGVLTGYMKQLKDIPAEQRPQFGQQINVAKQTLEQAITARSEVLAREQLDARLSADVVDVTLPGRVCPGRFRGRRGAGDRKRLL